MLRKNTAYTRLFDTGLILIIVLLAMPVYAEQKGYGGSAGHGGDSSPHGSDGGGGAFAGGKNEGSLEGGGRSGFGYWGGRHVPTGPGTDPGDSTDSGDSAGLKSSGSGSSTGYGSEGTLVGSCDDLSTEVVKAGNRLKDKNLVRINIAGAYLSSGVTVEKIKKSGSPRRNLANYQEELEKQSPDTTVAGIFLGLVIMQKVTPEVINKVNAILCVETNQQQTAAIAKMAEEQRQSIANKQ